MLVQKEDASLDCRPRLEDSEEPASKIKNFPSEFEGFGFGRDLWSFMVNCLAVHTATYAGPRIRGVWIYRLGKSSEKGNLSHQLQLYKQLVGDSKLVVVSSYHLLLEASIPRP